MAAGGGAACAACKYQRRRCTAECQLAEYFPQDRPRVFRNAHRLFGVSNILKTLARVGPERRRDAMRTIVYEANAWEAYPGQGCVPIIHHLHHAVLQTQLQIDQAKQSINAYRHALGIVSSDDDALLLHHHQQPPWMMDAVPVPAPAPDNNAAAQHPPPQDLNIHPPGSSSYHDDMSYYFLDDEMPANNTRESSSTDASSEKRPMEEPKMESVNNGFTLTNAATSSNLN
ncbi:hypothetical protein QOZ80_5AG0399710 [Eleusine coracana subsp. coracana]|nr:hypothetical protein QOZ80_5AG0399710 [Eleusine coracana subsp. coracana]